MGGIAGCDRCAVNSSPGKPKGDEQKDIAARVHRFQKAWRETPSPLDLRDYLPRSGETADTSCLIALIKTDMELRAEAGLEISLGYYLTNFLEPARITVPAQLLYEEYRLRQGTPGAPTLRDYRDRFPDQFEEFMRLILGTDGTPANAPGTADPGPTDGASTMAPKPAGETARSKDYRLIRKLGSGTYGEVWLAEDRNGLQVAIKKLFRSVDDAEGKRELRVLALIKNLRHPFVLATQSFWQESGQLWIVMELADGTIFDRFKEHRDRGEPGIPVDKLLGYVRDAAEALDFMHAHHVQHRDVKPKNLLLQGDRVKVGDFGLVREAGNGQLETATLCGTPDYMAPEAWRYQFSNAGDQYGLAVTYFQMRCGEIPFKAEGVPDIARAHLEDEPDLAWLPPREKDVLRKALARDPDERYPSCRAFAFALSQAAGAHPLPGSITPLLPPPARRLSWLLPVLAVLLLLALAGWGAQTFWLNGHSSGTDDDDNDKKTPVQEKPRPWLPAGFEAVEKDGLGQWPGTQRFYRTIRTSRFGVTFQYRLIPGGRVDEGVMDPFYMLEDKVTVGQFRAVAASSEFRTLLERLEMEHPATLARDPEDEDRGAWNDEIMTRFDDWPVQKVTVTAAHCFAVSLGCKLPTVKQWERAGGRYDGYLGPAVWRKGDTPENIEGIAVKRPRIDGKPAEPMKVGETTRDVSCYGCRNMAGNGLEWTRDVKSNTGLPRKVPLDKPLNTDQVFVRGHHYTKDKQYLFELESAAAYYFQTRTGFSFRVVLEIPDAELRR